MNRHSPLKPKPRMLHAALALLLCTAPFASHAALTDIGQTPVSSGPSGVVKPNVSFLLDSSGSMAWSHAPDESRPFYDGYGYKTSQCNSIYYNPAINYVPPKKSDNTSYPNQSFTAALYNGFDSGDGSVNLGTKFRAYDDTTSFNAGNDSQQAAYYYTYSGSAPVLNPSGGSNYTSTSSTFYKECNSAIGATPGKTVFTKVTVSSSSGPNGTDERTNFANWYSYYRTRMLMMKSAAGRAFATIGPAMRIGFMTIYATPSTNTSDADYLKIGDFDQTQKDSWYKRFYDQTPGGSTPLKKALSTAGRNYAGVLGPDPVQYSCQQNFTILTTDGYWNDGTANGVKINGSSSVGNQDNIEADTPSPEYDGGLSSSKDTLADVAAYYYRTDLRTSNCNTGVAGADVCTDNVPVKAGVDENPKQHMTTFTVGLGVNGKLAYADNYLTNGSADFNAIKQGTKDWPSPSGDTLTTIDDLWHAAVNGHGQYFSAKNPDNLVTGLRTALAGVSARDAAGAAAATSNLEPTAGDNYAYVANYRTQKWDGDVQARVIDLTSGGISDTAVWSTQQQLDTQTTDVSDSRTIFTYLNNVKTNFLPASFTAAQKTAWFTPDSTPPLSQYAGWSVVQKTAATADTVINWLRGQWGMDQRSTNTNKLYRQREHILGDIVNGRPVHVKKSVFEYKENDHAGFKASTGSRQRVVYAAANDGMLHAINGDTGKELWAYIPSFVLPNLKALADEAYATQHQYFVDGSPTVSDVWNGTSWRTILVGGLNAGGKGYYALDITVPASPQILWEFTDANMGYSFGNPIISKLTDGTWSVFVTTGYNNPDGIGRLYVLNALTGALKLTLATTGGTATTPSGLARISAFADSSIEDNTTLRVYGGDLLGNLWRFDVNGILPPTGKEATRLAILKVGSFLQPITTKPELGFVLTSTGTPITTKPVVYVGTGKYLGPSDIVDVNQQSLYAIRDDLTAAGMGDVRTAPACPFVKQTLIVTDVNNRSASATPVDWATKCGWYMDFNPDNTTPGERTSIDPRLQLGVLALATNIPEKSICTVGGSSFLYFLDYKTGSFIKTSAGTSPAGTRIGNALAVGLNVYRLPNGKVVATTTMSDDSHVTKPQPDVPPPGVGGRRVLWREIIN